MPSERWGLSRWALFLAAMAWADFQATTAAVAVAVAEVAAVATCRQTGVRGCWIGFRNLEEISWGEGRVPSPHRLVVGGVVLWAVAAALELAAAVEGTAG